MRHHHLQSKKACVGGSAKRKPRQRKVGFSPSADQTFQISALQAVNIGRHPTPEKNEGLKPIIPREASLYRIICLGTF
jgi:hypothetical protein